MLFHRSFQVSSIFALAAVVGCYTRDTEGLECMYDSDCLGLRCVGRFCSDTEGVTGAVSVAVGSEQACAVLADGTARCWGANLWGQLGYPEQPLDACGAAPKSLGPIDLGDAPDGVNVQQIATGGGIQNDGDRDHAHTCALLAGGRLKCWGMGKDNDFSGWLGYEDAKDVLDPAVAPVVPLTPTVKRIALGDRYTCAIFDDGRLGCWGMGAKPLGGYARSSVGGMPGDIRDLTPIAFGDHDAAVRAVSAGYEHACAVLEDDTAWCWGVPSDYGRLGGEVEVSGTVVPPVRVEFADGMGAPLDVRTGTYHSCALLADDTIACWGCNVEGALGIPADDPSLVSMGTCSEGVVDRPVLATSVQAAIAGEHIVQLVSSGNHNCVLLADASVHCWGANDMWQLGDTGGPSPTPRVVKLYGEVLRAVEIASGGAQVCAVTEAGKVVCWGDNRNGQARGGSCDVVTSPPVSVELL